MTIHKTIKWATCLTLTLGFAIGMIAVLATLDHNPQQEYSKNPMGLIPIFISWFSVISGPCLLIRHLMLWQDRYLNGALLLSILAAVVTNIFTKIIVLDNLIYMPVIAMWFYTPCHAVIFLLECRKNKP
jgi:hypothetical protein